MVAMVDMVGGSIQRRTLISITSLEPWALTVVIQTSLMLSCKTPTSASIRLSFAVWSKAVRVPSKANRSSKWYVSPPPGDGDACGDACGDGGGDDCGNNHGVQSVQSVPRAHNVYSAPGPPSSQSPSEAY